jgi:hypothetical protein
MKASEDMLQAFSALGFGTQPSEDDIKYFEQFVCLLYQPSSASMKTLSALRWHMFKQTQAESEKLPPTQGALRQHILRAHYQCIVWWNDVKPIVELPDPTEYGWAQCNGVFTPVVTLLKPAPECIVELVRCKCKSGRCRGNCSCRVAGMVCSEMCKCEGHPDVCENADVKLNEAENIDSEGSDVDDTSLERTVEYFPYSAEDVEQCWIDAVQEDEVDNIVNVSDMETED